MKKPLNLIEYLRQIEDPRRKEGQRYELESVLLMIIISIMAGKTGYREIGRFSNANKEIFIKFYKKSKGKLPTYKTIRAIVKGLNFDNVLKIFHEWSEQFVSIEEGEWFAIDGKALCSTVTAPLNEYQNFVSIVSIFSHKKGQVIKMGKYESKKESEISTVEELLKCLELKDLVFTLDALHCQKKL